MSEQREELVLNVDDTEAACYVKSHILARAGFKVIEARSGREAIDMARQHMPALVVLDVKLPDINGYEVCRVLKEDPRTQGILILQTSASFVGPENKVRALDNGADNYLAEPFEPEELIANVRAMLRLGRVERELRNVARRKDEFLAVLAHELRNPLAPIKSAVELLRELRPQVSPAEDEARSIILRQTRHLVRLVDDLLDVARISRGQIRLRVEDVDLAEAVRSAIETSATMVHSRQHKLNVRLPEEACWARGDPVRIAQIVANLINNAAKFTPPGGQIDVTLDGDGNEARIRVQDNGVGIPPSQQARIFELFAQASASEDRAQEGLGIGLFLVKTLIEMHHGAISVSSGAQGKGSVFELRLPQSRGPRAGDGGGASQSAAAESESSAPAPRRVLVVDDNIDAAHLISTLLEMDGHTVEQCYNGARALERAREMQPEVVVLDIGLPDMSGLEVARAMRQLPGMQSALIIALTGYGQERDKEAVQAAGFNMHLTKPVMYEQLAQALAKPLIHDPA